jgi:uncharacterized protein (DUF1330 family)
VDTVEDFEDLLDAFERFGVRYLVIGGLAFIFHAKPRYTKDMDLWIDPDPVNVARANEALADFGSPYLLDPGEVDEILQLGVAPNRIDLLRSPEGPSFSDAWQRRIDGSYGRVLAHWVDLDTLIDIKSRIDDPRHQEDARVLRLVRERRAPRDGMPG